LIQTIGEVQAGDSGYVAEKDAAWRSPHRIGHAGSKRNPLQRTPHLHPSGGDQARLPRQCRGAEQGQGGGAEAGWRPRAGSAGPYPRRRKYGTTDSTSCRLSESIIQSMRTARCLAPGECRSRFRAVCWPGAVAAAVTVATSAAAPDPIPPTAAGRFHCGGESS
jgi:hypothetical protein